MKVSELTGAALDWAVTKAEGFDSEVTGPEWGSWGWATDWGQGGPIIERYCINVFLRNNDYDGGGYWCATTDTGDPPKFGPTPLVAAMRCYVASQMGDEIEVPDELMTDASA